MKDQQRATGMFGNLVRALRSRRTAAVSLLSFASGLPLGLVWFAIPDWMRDIGVDIRVVGLFSLAQAPWAFKVLWSPLMDRFVPPFWGRRRGWMAITQIALFGLGLVLAGVGHRPEAIWVVAAIALATGLASASQDIAYNAYMVEVLEKDEQGAVVGVQVAFYRAAMALAGGLAITMAARVGWPIVNLFLALVYIPMLIVTWWAPEPRVAAVPPRSLRDAVWLPFLEMLSRPRALEILAFVVMYKIADQLSQALTRPFLIDMGYNADHRGIALATIGLAATIVGSVVGGWITTLAGLGHALWIFGLLQIFSNIGYWAIAWFGAPNLPLMYSATSFELLTSGLGTGAFSVLLIRLTEKRFSATQYALFSSLFALPRVLAGPIAGFAVDAMGWQAFYLSTLVVGIPGLVLLARFVPPGTREPRFEVSEIASQRAVGSAASPSELATWGIGFGILAGVAGSLIVALMAALDAMRQKRGSAFEFSAAWSTLWHPASIGDWLQLVSIVAFAAASGLVAVAALAARRRHAPLTSPSEVLPDRAGRSSI